MNMYDIKYYKKSIHRMLIMIVFLKIIDMITSYIGISNGFHEINPLPLFFIAGFIFILLVLIILTNFDLFFNTDSILALRFSYYCYLFIIIMQFFFVLNNLRLLL